jgi:hypothetical protein
MINHLKQSGISAYKAQVEKQIGIKNSLMHNYFNEIVSISENHPWYVEFNEVIKKYKMPDWL